jgi:hypothetical protein
MLKLTTISLLLWLPLSLSGFFSIPREITPSGEISSVDQKGDSAWLDLRIQDYPQYVILSFKPHSGVTLDGIDFTGPQDSGIQGINAILEELPVMEIRNLFSRQHTQSLMWIAGAASKAHPSRQFDLSR